MDDITFHLFVFGSLLLFFKYSFEPFLWSRLREDYEQRSKISIGF